MLTLTETPTLQEQSLITSAKIIGDLRTYQYNVDISTKVEVVSNRLKGDLDLHGVLLLDGDKCVGTASRLKIFELLGRPFGIDLFFKKPIGHLFKTTQLSKTVFPYTTSIDEAVINSLNRAPEVRYEPVIVSKADGKLYLLDMNVLLMAQADQLANANRLIEKQVEVGKELSSTLDLPKVLTMILEQIESIMPFHRAAILLDREDNLDFAASRGYPDNYNFENSSMNVNKSRVFREITKNKLPLAIHDAVLEDDFPHSPGIPPTRSWLGLPLLADDELLGLISISRTQVAPFTRGEINNSSLITGQAAVALSNARLYQRTQTFNQQLESRVRERTIELQKANYKLEALDLNKTNFINFALQELMTPMIAVSGFSQILEIDSSLKKKQRDLIKKMASNVKTLNKIIHSMMDVARLDAQKMELNYTRLNLFSMLIEVTEELKPVMRERQIKCKLKHLDVIPLMLGDAHALRKVFYNLVANAIKYTPDGGKITVKAHNPAKRDGNPIPSAVQITITDTGIGIDPNDQEMIFDKFYRSEKQSFSRFDKTNFQVGGSGLGLAIAKGIVEAHGGQIWVESPGLDDIDCPGSSFHIALPIPNLSIRKDFPAPPIDNPLLTLS